MLIFVGMLLMADVTSLVLTKLINTDYRMHKGNLKLNICFCIKNGFYLSKVDGPMLML